jgi:hypothetical protein
VRVFFSVDVEVWCDEWNDLERQFPDAFARYIYGPTPRGDYGLPMTLSLLRDHGLAGVFFVEPLFSARFGPDPLAEIVGLIQGADQEVQLHLHPEWVDEARPPILESYDGKRQFMWMFSAEQQANLIATGARMLHEAGAGRLRAFRAGNFGLGRDTWSALRDNGLIFDSSYNYTALGSGSGLDTGEIQIQPYLVDGVFEYPVTVFRDGFGRYRPAQLGACSYGELERLLWQGVHAGWESLVIVSHSFELLNPRMDRPDDIVVRRFRELCRLLDRHRDVFDTTGFARLEPRAVVRQPELQRGTFGAAGVRVVEQAWRRLTN